MSLQLQINEDIKTAMRAKDTLALEALRAVKSAILLALTEGGAKDVLSEDEEIKILQRLIKQRKDSAAIYSQQGREDLAQPEIDQAAIIEKYLPKQLSEAEVEAVVAEVLKANGLSGMAAMGQVMGIVSKQLAGQADGKTISNVVKKLLA
jgi:uncharacterized protein YqeY